MKAASFDYLRPNTVPEACAYLAMSHEEQEVRLIAGGQSLIPMMALRLAQPSTLVDISRLGALTGVVIKDDVMVVKACTTQALTERSKAVQNHLPLLAQALHWVAHPSVRTRGTVGGSLAHADPAAEIPLVACVLEAQVIVQSIQGVRSIAAADLLQGAMETSVMHNECITEIHFPLPCNKSPLRHGSSFTEIAKRAGDFALLSAAVQISLNPDESCVAIRLGLGNAASTPLCLDNMAARLMGSFLTDADIDSALVDLQEMIAPSTDTHANETYRRWCAPKLLKRAIRQAREQARAREELA